MGRKKKQKFDLDTVFRFNSDIMEIMNIPKIDIIDDHEELWKYEKFDRDKLLTKNMKYFVSNYGRVYNIEKKKILKIHESDFFKSSIETYRHVVIPSSDKKNKKYLLHRLVMFTFVEEDKERPFVNHIDGHPSHNYLWNLEWVNAKENFEHALRTGLVNQPKGEDRPNALWTTREIHEICKMMEEGHKATYIYHVLAEVLKDPKVEYERVRTLYKHIRKRTHWTHISCLYDIDFSSHDYSKEKGSINKAKYRKSNKSNTGGDETSLIAGNS